MIIEKLYFPVLFVLKLNEGARRIVKKQDKGRRIITCMLNIHLHLTDGSITLRYYIIKFLEYFLSLSLCGKYPLMKVRLIRKLF